MSSLALDAAAQASAPSPSFIPPRTSSHGVAFASSPPQSSSHDKAAATIIDPPTRKSSKRPVSTTSENWLAQSSGKKPLTVDKLSSIPSHRSRGHSQSHRPKSAHAHDRTSGTPVKFGSRSVLPMAPGQPPEDPPKTIGDELIHAKHAPWSKEKENILLAPYDYLFGQPGKDIRSQCINAFNKWLKVPDDRLAVITRVIGMLHTASLLVDDVEDSSLLRRGEPVANNIFGVPQVINSANYVYFLALQDLTTLHNPATIQIFTEELINLHRGQGMDLFWRDTLTCPTEADYLEMVSNKTGGLFRLAIKLMQAESTVLNNPSHNPIAHAEASSSAPPPASINDSQSMSCVILMNTIGLLFQILDDLLNLSSPAYTARKGHAEDLTEGKFSFPVIHAIRSDPSNLVLLNILRQRTTDPEVKRYAVEYMERKGSFEYTRRVIAELEKKAVKELTRLEGCFEGGKDGAERIKALLGKLKAL